MTNIRSALTAAQWREGVEYSFTVRDRESGIELLGDVAARAIIALGNDELADDDPLKITHDTVAMLRRVSGLHPELGRHEELDDLADVLESYLPHGSDGR